MDIIKELMYQREEMERDAIKYQKMGYYCIADRLLEIASYKTSIIRKQIKEGRGQH